MGFHVFEQLEDGSIKFEGMMQTDFNVGSGIGKVGAAVAIQALPKNLKTWFQNLEAYLKKATNEDKR